MTTFELDLSKSDSLIDDIQKIFKPPSVETSTNTRMAKNLIRNCDPSHKESALSASSKTGSDDNDSKVTKSWKKPKPNSHDYCDSCSTFEGERLVCDKCPASFHLECLDPPIDIDEAPVGVWYCNRCTAIMKEDDDKYSSISGNSGNKGDVTMSNGAGKRSGSSVSSEITTEMSDEVPNKRLKLSEFSQNGLKSLPALQNLIEVLQCINPKEFELPKSMIPAIKIPNTFKSPIEMKSKSLISLENGMVPRPVVRCFSCTRTCFYGTLVQCDYCPLYYHLDCVDPPLVQLPSRVERWMCPNHIEQVIDSSGNVQSLLLSERIKAYDQIKSTMDKTNELDIISDFTSGSGFRFDNQNFDSSVGKTKTSVPDAVKRLYRQPLASVNSKEIDYDCDLSDENKQLINKLFTKSNLNFESFNDPKKLLVATLDSLNILLNENKLNLNNEISLTKPIINTKSGGDELKSRAILIPINKDNTEDSQQNPIRILYRNFTIGSSSNCDCIVTKCRYISALHASINYVDNHFCYELINYSRYGTVVDNLMYYNDISNKDSINNKPINNVTNLRNFIGKSQNSANQSNQRHKSRMTTQRDCDKPNTDNTCHCDDYGYKNDALNDCIDKGWEGSAPLKFGSIFKVGCQRFIFASMDHNSDENKTTSSKLAADGDEGEIEDESTTEIYTQDKVCKKGYESNVKETKPEVGNTNLASCDDDDDDDEIDEEDDEADDNDIENPVGITTHYKQESNKTAVTSGNETSSSS